MRTVTVAIAGTLFLLVEPRTAVNADNLLLDTL
jgi:hypothetical protein